MVPGVGLVPSYPPTFWTKTEAVFILVSELGTTKTESAFLLVKDPFSSPPAIISQFRDDAELYVVGCKQHYLIESYFLFVDDTIKQLVAEDEQKFTSNFI